MNLSEQIRKLPAAHADWWNGNEIRLYEIGHYDARHAAAELALKADACIEALRDIVKQQKTMGFDGSPSDDLMDKARQALAALETP
jgi:hypothetical protein